MVCIRMSDECEKGNHKDCKGDDSDSRVVPKKGEIVFGGWMCPCGCHKEPAMSTEEFLKKKREWEERCKNALPIEFD